MILENFGNPFLTKMFPNLKNLNDLRICMPFCQLNLLVIDYPIKIKFFFIGSCKESRDFWIQIIWI